MIMILMMRCNIITELFISESIMPDFMGDSQSEVNKEREKYAADVARLFEVLQSFRVSENPDISVDYSSRVEFWVWYLHVQWLSTPVSPALIMLIN